MTVPIEDTELDRIYDDGEKAIEEILQWQILANIDPLTGKAPAPEISKPWFEKIEIRRKEIEDKYKDFIRRNRKNDTALICYGNFLGGIGDEDAAVGPWKRALIIEPKNPVPWNNLANVYGHHGPIQKAFRYYEQAIKLDPKSPLYLQNLATTVFLFRVDAQKYYKDKDEQRVLDRALALYEKAIALDPHDLNLWVDYAISFDGIRPLRSEAAIKVWNQIIALANESKNQVLVDSSKIHIARFQFLSKDYLAARATLSEIREFEGQDPSTIVHRDRLLKQIGIKESEAR